MRLVYLIMNPGARGGKSRKKFSRIFQLLDQANISYEFKTTNSIKDAYLYSVEANKNDYDIIVAVGGDGTINAVLNGFYDTSGRRISNSRLAVIYTGTSPDFCKSYNIPTTLNQAVQILIYGKSVKIDVGKITLSGAKASELKNKGISYNWNGNIRYFGCCTNIGLGATLARYANSGIRKYLGDFAGTFVSLIRILFTYKANDYTVIVDGKKDKITNLYNISIGRTKYIASGIKVHNTLKVGDGRFYCLTVQKLNFFKIPDLIRKVYIGNPFRNNNHISLFYCRTIEIYGNDRNTEVEFDGDPSGYLPCKIEMAENQLDLLIQE